MFFNFYVIWIACLVCGPEAETEEKLCHMNETSHMNETTPYLYVWPDAQSISRSAAYIDLDYAAQLCR